MLKYFLIILFTFVLLSNCDHGLVPPLEEINGIEGVIHFQNWPPADSLKDLRLVVFKNYPPTNIVGEVFNRRAVVYPPLGSESLPFFEDSTSFFMELDTGSYEYIVVAQQYGENLMADWKAVGQYDITGTGLDSFPTPIQVLPNTILENIDINVDFNNIPVQPF